MTDEPTSGTARITIVRNGPYIVTGRIPLSRQSLVCDREGNSVRWKEGEHYPAADTYSLCRCGGSQNMPFCDGTHRKISFNGTETASRVSYMERAGWIEGPDIALSDAPGFCSHARFCMRGKGIWDLVRQSSDLEARKMAIEMAANCHSGRLVVWDKKTNRPIEPAFEKSIGVVQEPGGAMTGPLWVRGGIPVISSDGFAYEIRKRVTLCCCGKSGNKPFCDGSHRAGR